jgi:hypothetical protein
MVISDIEEKHCSYHPNVLTRLRCSKCGKPICPRCAVETPVGFRCPDCASVRGLPTYQTNTIVLLKSIGIGLVIAIVVGLVWGRFPDWNFYLALILGFGVTEGMAWGANYKRGSDLQIAAIVCVVIGLALARVVIAEQCPFFTLSDLLNHPSAPGVAQTFQIRLLPDFIFAALALAIPYIRFR